jgi:hypothetical protein
MYSLTPQFDGDGPGLTPSAAVTADAAASPVSVAQSSSMYSQGPAATGPGTAPVKSAPKAIDKSKWNTGVKVPQTTIDAVKAAGKGNMGVNAATKAAGMGKGNAGAGADAKYANRAASGRPNSPYGFGGTPSKPKPSVNEDGRNSRAAKPSVNEDGRNSRAANKTKPFPSFMPNPRGAAGQSPFIPIKP